MSAIDPSRRGHAFKVEVRRPLQRPAPYRRLRQRLRARRDRRRAARAARKEGGERLRWWDALDIPSGSSARPVGLDLADRSDESFPAHGATPRTAEPGRARLVPHAAHLPDRGRVTAVAVHDPAHRLLLNRACRPGRYQAEDPALGSARREHSTTMRSVPVALQGAIRSFGPSGISGDPRPLRRPQL